MQNKKFTVAIIGVGGRGGFAYGTLINNLPEKFDIVTYSQMRTLSFKKSVPIFC